jgi:hypothetical protein
LKQSGVIVDPELAEVLKSRRQRHDEVDEEEEDQKLTAQEEIQKARYDTDIFLDYLYGINIFEVVPLLF